MAQQTQDAISKKGNELVTKPLPETVRQPMQQAMQEQRQAAQQQQATQPAQPAAAQQQPALGDESEILKYLQEQAEAEKAKMETLEQRAKREKREKWSSAISSIGDAASSIANLYFTSQYAPNMYSGHNTLSAANQARIDKAKAERDKVRDNYINYALKIEQLKDNERDWQYKQQKAADEKAQQQFENALKLAKEERDNALANLNLQLTAGKIDEQGYKTQVAQAEAKYADAKEKAEVDASKARAQASRASATASYASARNANARTAKTYHDMAAEGSGKHTVGGTFGVKQRNWDNDSYINQLWIKLGGEIGRGSEKSYKGASQLWSAVNDETSQIDYKGNAADRKRAALEEFFSAPYNNDAQDELGGFMTEFDNSYNSKKK